MDRRRIAMAATATARRRDPQPPVPLCNGSERLDVFLPGSAMTLDGFRDWATSPSFPEYIRAAFINGEVWIDMSNEDPELHVMVKGIIFGSLLPLCRTTKSGRLYQDGML